MYLQKLPLNAHADMPSGASGLKFRQNISCVRAAKDLASLRISAGSPEPYASLYCSKIRQVIKSQLLAHFLIVFSGSLSLLYQEREGQG